MNAEKFLSASAMVSGRAAGARFGAVAGVIGSIFFEGFWKLITGVISEQVTVMPFWLKLVLGGFIGGCLGYAFAHLLLLIISIFTNKNWYPRPMIVIVSIGGALMGVLLTRNNTLGNFLVALISSQTEGRGIILIILGIILMLYSCATILSIPGAVFGLIIGAIFKFSGLITGVLTGIILFLSMWRISVVVSSGAIGSRFNGALVGMFMGMFFVDKMLKNNFSIIKNEIKSGSDKDLSIEQVCIYETVTALIGGVVGAILGGIGVSFFKLT